MSGWTEERVEQLKKLWLLGWSASQIAKELGAVTRNAVIGKIHRLDLVARQTPKLTPPPALSTFPSASFMGSKLGKGSFTNPSIAVKPVAAPASPYQTPGVAFAQLAARGQQGSHGKLAKPGTPQGSQGSLPQARALPEKAAGLAAAYGSYGTGNNLSERPLDKITSLMGTRGPHGGLARQCQWPVGDPRSAGFHFCGCASMEAQPYCSEHAKLAYQPSGKSRRVNVGSGDLHNSGTPDEREISIRA